MGIATSHHHMLPTSSMTVHTFVAEQYDNISVCFSRSDAGGRGLLRERAQQALARAQRQIFGTRCRNKGI